MAIITLVKYPYYDYNMPMKRAIDFELLRWKTHPQRLPLLVRGARQVGKSYAVEKFGKENFDSLVVANFEFQPELASCFDTLDPVRIIAKLELRTNSSIRAGQTLLFLDEIQQCPQAILALRYFKEKMPSLHVIAAGSLLEFALHDAQFSFPVGRVQFMYMRPLSFSEFLQALGEERLFYAIQEISLQEPFDSAIHKHLMNFVRQYFLVGGMPAVIQTFLETQSYLETQQRQSILLQTYRNDFGKYAAKTQHKYLQRLFEQAPRLVGQHFKYSKVDADMRARELKVAIEQLRWAGLINIVYATAASGLPLEAQIKENRFKLLFLDIGLMQNSTQIDAKSVLEDDVLQINAGALAEQFVGQEFLCLGDSYQERRLYFWDREKKGSSAEVDYVVNFGSRIIPVEVKAGKTGRLRSIQQFIEEKRSAFGVRISGHPLSLENNILSVPLYLIDQLPRLIASMASITTG